MSNEDPPVLSARHVRLWVWGCSDESIALGQISVLAVAEVVMAVALYWWLASHFDWSWMAFVSLIAAPMLLLRSPESVELGVSMLRRFWKRKHDDYSKREKYIVALVSTVAVGVAVYWLATIWLLNWSFYWRVALLSMIAFVIANMSAFVSFGGGKTEDIGPSAIVGAMVGATVSMSLLAELVEGLVVGMVVGMVAVAWATAIHEAKNKAINGVASLFLGIVSISGVLLRSMLIRWIVIFYHLLPGLANLPKNWRETLLIIDFLNPPELLPQAGKVHRNFIVRGVWRDIVKESAYDGWTRLFYLMVVVALYLPALVYRWNLKASAWLWWPLALALSSPLEGLDGKMCREKTAISVGGAWRWLLPVIPAVVFAWLILSALPRLDFLLTILPEVATKLTEKLLHLAEPPPFGARLIALWLGCVFALFFWWRTKNLKASHGKVLESPKEFNDLLPEDKVRFLQLARPIEKLRLLLIVTVLVLGEAYAISIFHAVNPPLADKLVAPWLLQVL